MTIITDIPRPCTLCTLDDGKYMFIASDDFSDNVYSWKGIKVASDPEEINTLADIYMSNIITKPTDTPLHKYLYKQQPVPKNTAESFSTMKTVCFVYRIFMYKEWFKILYGYTSGYYVKKRKEYSLIFPESIKEAINTAALRRTEYISQFRDINANLTTPKHQYMISTLNRYKEALINLAESSNREIIMNHVKQIDTAIRISKEYLEMRKRHV